MKCEYLKGTDRCTNSAKRILCVKCGNPMPETCCFVCVIKCDVMCRKARVDLKGYCVPDECKHVGECRRCRR